MEGCKVLQICRHRTASAGIRPEVAKTLINWLGSSGGRSCVLAAVLMYAAVSRNTISVHGSTNILNNSNNNIRRTFGVQLCLGRTSCLGFSLCYHQPAEARNSLQDKIPAWRINMSSSVRVFVCEMARNAEMQVRRKCGEFSSTKSCSWTLSVGETALRL